VSTHPAQSERVVITGAAGEIGFAMAQRYAAAGARLVLTDLNATRLDEVRNRLPAHARITVTAHDVTSMEAARAVATVCEHHLGQVDTVICCAGLYEELHLETVDETAWRRSLAVNLDGVFYTVQALRPLLAKGSAVINIASLAGHRGSVSHTPYAAAKGGVLTLTRSLAQELAPHTRVNNISPGLIDTGMVRALDTGRREAMIAATPLGRLGSAEEVADVAVFLSSPAAAFMTGETLQVNGGLYLHS